MRRETAGFPSFHGILVSLLPGEQVCCPKEKNVKDALFMQRLMVQLQLLCPVRHLLPESKMKEKNGHGK